MRNQKSEVSRIIQQSNTKLQSLNSQIRMKETKRIMKDNDKIYDTIKMIKSNIDTKKSLDDYDQIIKTR